MNIEEEIKLGIEKKLLMIGANYVIKAMKQGKISKVILASNCPANFKDEILHLGKIANNEVFESDKSNENLGMLCRKQFKITVIGIKKA